MAVVYRQPKTWQPEPDPLTWYFKPNWRSIALWPIGLYYIGGILIAAVCGLAAEWDIIRWNFIVWLVFGWNVPAVLAFAPAIGYYLAFAWTHQLWQSERLHTWWAWPIKAVTTYLLTMLPSAPGWLILFTTVSWLDGHTDADFSTLMRVVEVVGSWGVWLHF